MAPSPNVSKEIEAGKQFIIVDDMPLSSIPEGYTLIDMKYKNNSFKALIPQNLLFYMANPGEGNIDDALDQITEFYNNAKDYEDDFIDDGNTSVQQASWSTLAKKSYETYLINKLVKTKNGAYNDGEPVAEFDANVLKQYGFSSHEVDSRARAIAALLLNKNLKDIKEQNIEHILVHVTETKNLSKEEFKNITCWAGSHYELKSEYKSQGYAIEHKHDKEHMVGKKTVTTDYINASIENIEKEALSLMTETAKKDPHSEALFRQYINLKYISKENPGVQLPIMPKGDGK